MLRAPGLSEDFRAHLQLTAAVGADAGLHTPPSVHEGTHVAPELFRVAVASRLRLQLLEEPCCCPFCGAAMDVYADHALVCACGGDRTLRHNAVRDAVHAHSCEAGSRPEREKPGLLLP